MRVPFSAIAVVLSAGAAVGVCPGGGCSGSGDGTRGPAVRFRLPVANPTGEYLSDIVIGVDHDPVDYGGTGYRCLSYNGEVSFPYCYDQHTGTDFLLAGEWEMMDAEVAWVVAAADGTVVEVEDGNYDRCHATTSGNIDCDGHPMAANYVILEHVEGYRTSYWHLKTGSIVVAPGDSVACGERLGLIGSSGVSAMPHLHFQVHGPDGDVIDPFAGEMSQPESYWVKQVGLFGVPGEFCKNELTSDSDGDGHVDPEDNCPDHYNPDQADDDLDLFGNVCDPN